MQTVKRSIIVICLSAIILCMSANIKAKADAIEAAEVIANNVQGADLTSIAYAYNNLSLQQKLIADYLMGAYNYAYLCARGFSFNIDQTETNMKAQLGAIGERVWQYITTAYGWRSRFDEVFRQYASSIIVYAAKINVSFDTWISEILSGDRNVYIEYSKDAFDAWTAFYNDPSGDGIASFGHTVGSWVSGNFYDFDFVGYPWYTVEYENSYNNFVLNYSPVLYSNREDRGYWPGQCIAGNFTVIVNALYVKRSNTAYSSFRWGIYNGTTHRILNTNDKLTVGGYVLNNHNKLQWAGASTTTFQKDIYNSNTGFTQLSDLIQYAFDLTPINANLYDYRCQFWYPFIEHVYLVDDLNTLSNPEEVFDVTDFNIVPPGMADYIITPNGKMLIPGYAPIEDPFDDLWDVSVDINNNPASEDDYSTQIVNNTVINNYMIDASDKINVPTTWFDNPLTDQLANDSIPFLAFARDCIDTLGDLQIYFYGAIVIGLGGGVLKKLLL